MKYLFTRISLLLISILVSHLINTYYIDELLHIFNIMSYVALLLNRVSLAVFIYFSVELFFIVRKYSIQDIINKLFLVYFIWLMGLLFGRFTNLSDYNLDAHFYYSFYHPLITLLLF